MTAAEPGRYLITGGTSGIGRYCAEHMASSGDQVWITGTSTEGVGRTVEKLGLAGGSVCNLASDGEVEEAVQRARQEMGRLDGVFANAGIDGENRSAQDLSLGRFEKLLRVNTVGLLATAQAAYRHLDRPGTLVVNASVNALRPEHHFADYNASKAAAMSLAQSFALDWGRDDISVTCIAPGYIPSRMTNGYLEDPQISAELKAQMPIGRFGTPQEIAELVRFLISNTVPFLHGSVIPVAGGRSI